MIETEKILNSKVSDIIRIWYCYGEKKIDCTVSTTDTGDRAFKVL